MNNLFDKKTKQYLIMGIILISFYFGFFYIDGLRKILLGTYAVFRPIIYGLVIAFMINLPMSFFEEKVFSKILDKHKTAVLILSLVASWILFFAVVTIILTVLIPELTKAISGLIENMPAFFDSLVKFLEGSRFTNQLSDVVANKLDKLDINNISKSITDFIQGFFFAEGNIFNRTSNILSSLSSGLMAIFIGFVFSIYVSLNKKELKINSIKLLYAHFNEDFARQAIYISKLSYDSFARFLETRILSCLSLGLICFLGMLILRLPSAGMISILVGAFDMIPYFGPIIATGIGIVLIFIQSPTQALMFLIFIMVIQQIQEQIFYPLVIGKHQGLPPIWIFVSVLLGGGLFGIFGMIAFMPLATVVYTLSEDNLKRKLKDKNIQEEDIEEISQKTFDQMRKEKQEE